MTINLPLDLPEDFTFGDCHSCPLSYEAESYDEDDGYDFYDLCVLGNWECPLTALACGMREATPEESKSVDNYIKSISEPTGVTFGEAVNK